jgi:DNA repair exonuclease SbcCD ATPase subunit
MEGNDLPMSGKQITSGTENTANTTLSIYQTMSSGQRIDSLEELISHIKLDRAIEKVRLANAEERASTLREANKRLVENERNNQIRYNEIQNHLRDRDRELADARQQITDLENRLYTKDREFDDERRKRMNLQDRNNDLENQLHARANEISESQRQIQQLRDQQHIERAEHRNLRNRFANYETRLSTIIKVASGSQHDNPVPNMQAIIERPQNTKHKVEYEHADLDEQTNLQDSLIDCQNYLHISQTELARARREVKELQAVAKRIANLDNPLEPIRRVLNDDIIEALMTSPADPQPRNYIMTTSTCNMGPNRKKHEEFGVAFGKGWWIKRNGKYAWIKVWLQTQS